MDLNAGRNKESTEKISTPQLNTWVHSLSPVRPTEDGVSE